MTTIRESNKYNDPTNPTNILQTEYQEPIERVPYDFGITRRGFVQVLGAGLLITVTAGTALGQRRGGPGGGRPVNRLRPNSHRQGRQNHRLDRQSGRRPGCSHRTDTGRRRRIATCPFPR